MGIYIHVVLFGSYFPLPLVFFFFLFFFDDIKLSINYFSFSSRKKGITTNIYSNSNPKQLKYLGYFVSFVCAVVVVVVAFRWAVYIWSQVIWTNERDELSTCLEVLLLLPLAAPELCAYIRSSGLKYQKVGCRLGRRSHESFALVSYTSHAIRVHQLILFVSLYCHLWLQTNNFCCRVCRPRRESLRDFISFRLPY